MRRKYSDKYNATQLESHGIWITYIVNPNTFKPCIRIFSKHDLHWIAEKEFNMLDGVQIINNFIDENVDKIIQINRKRKIEKIKNKL